VHDARTNPAQSTLPLWQRSGSLRYATPSHRVKIVAMRSPWLRFQLSSAFVLLSILCWVLATRPFWHEHHRIIAWIGANRSQAITVIDRAKFPLSQDEEELLEPLQGSRRVNINNESYYRPNPSLFWPGLAFATFIGWKCRKVATRPTVAYVPRCPLNNSPS